MGLREAVLQGLPPDGGLYLPERIPVLPDSFWQKFPDLAFADLAYEMAAAWISPEEMPADTLRALVADAINFDAPVVPVEENTAAVELFHGNTLAFKDFGARFMARLMRYFVAQSERPLRILVATSGDTGSAVAHGFLDVAGISVTVLYPAGKVSDVQERQFTTLGRNITALAIDGTFDDCQRLVKQAFLDETLTRQMWLSSANSINIARLLPQMFYYARAIQQQMQRGISPEKTAFVVPSGNFGNLTAGILARRMGLPFGQMIAATNANDIVPKYLLSGDFSPKPSVATLSNAMDVGNPSNFARLFALFGESVAEMRAEISAYSLSDDETRRTAAELFAQTGYATCPHTAVGFAAAHADAQLHPDRQYLVLATAHPAKFDSLTGEPHALPQRLAHVLTAEKLSIPMQNDYAALKQWLQT